MEEGTAGTAGFLPYEAAAGARFSLIAVEASQ